MIFIKYQNTTLSITVSTDNRDVDINAPNKVFEKKMKNVDGSRLEEMLEKLLVETEEHHQLLKNRES